VSLSHPFKTLLASFPALVALGLGDDDLAVLRRNGYVQQDRRRADGGGYGRLRFRKEGRLRTVYLGREPGRLARVRRELRTLQATRTARREQRRAVRRRREVVRRAKARLAPVLEQFGFHFHGDLIRKLRGSSASSAVHKDGEDEYGCA
jgi:hypothetical protein